MATRPINTAEAKLSTDTLKRKLFRILTDDNGDDVLDADGQPQVVMAISGEGLTAGPGGTTVPADLPYTYNSATTSDPGGGAIGFDSTTPASITSMRLNFTDGDGTAQSGIVSALTNSGGGTMLMRWDGGSLTISIGVNEGSFGSYAQFEATRISGGLPTDGTEVTLDFAISDSVALIGVPQGSTHLGTFTGTIIPDAQTVKEALQALEAELEAAEALAEGPVLGTSTAIAFDRPRVYFTPSTPGNGSITYDTSGAVPGTESVGYFNHAAEPTWPAGTQRSGMVWNNSAYNKVRFMYTADGVSAEVTNNGTINYTSPLDARVITGGADIVTTSTTPTNITGLAKTGTALHKYLCLAWLRVSGTAASGVNVGWGGSGYTIEANYFGPSSGATAFLTGPGNTLGTVATADFSEFGTTTNSFVLVMATLIIGASDATMQMQVASEVAANNSTIYRANSGCVFIDCGLA